jgi:hypothetical protein
MPTCGRCTGSGSEYSKEPEDAPDAARKCSLPAGPGNGIILHRYRSRKVGQHPSRWQATCRSPQAPLTSRYVRLSLAQEYGVSHRTADMRYKH